MATQPRGVLRTHHTSSVAYEIIEAGAVAGLLGGVAMALFATTYAAAVGDGGWTPVSAIASTVFGASVQGAGAALAGVAVHLVTSMGLGILFAWVTPRDVSSGPALALGAFAGVAILVAMNLLVLPTYDWTAPRVGPLQRSHLMWGNVPGLMPHAGALVSHVIFGAGLALAPGLRRRFGAK